MALKYIKTGFIARELCQYRVFEAAGYDVVIVCYSGVLVHLNFGAAEEIEARVLGEFSQIRRNDGLAEGLVGQLRDFFAGKPVEFDCELDLWWASEFGVKVLRGCGAINYGKRLTYGQLARQAGSPGAARAVGTVMAKNRIPIIIGCHRVMAVNGKIGNYSAAGGVGTKIALLDMEEKGLGGFLV